MGWGEVIHIMKKKKKKRDRTKNKKIKTTMKKIRSQNYPKVLKYLDT